MYRLGIDLGGTNIVAGIVDEGYNILAKHSVKTGLPCDSQTIVNKMVDVSLASMDALGIKYTDILAAGIGSPGIIDSNTGVVKYASNLQFNNVPLAHYFKRITGLNTYLANDANAAAYAEFIAGSGRGSKNFAAITLGTGIGGGIIINSKIYSGSHNGAGEIGHMIIKKGGRKCACGQNGCFEAYASATALINDTIKIMKNNEHSLLWQLCGGKLENVNGKTAFDAMRLNDPCGIKVVKKYTEYLGAGILSLINIFSPDSICIGGGISKERDALIKPVLEYLKEQGCTKPTQIKIASLGNNAGVIGAAYIMDAN